MQPVVEVMTFEGSPHPQPALDLVQPLVWRAGSPRNGARDQCSDLETAETHGFLGSPTICGNSRDVEPGDNELSEFVLSCRVYHSDGAFKGETDERWLRIRLIATS